MRRWAAVALGIGLVGAGLWLGAGRGTEPALPAPAQVGPSADRPGSDVGGRDAGRAPAAAPPVESAQDPRVETPRRGPSGQPLPDPDPARTRRPGLHTPRPVEAPVDPAGWAALRQAADAAWAARTSEVAQDFAQAEVPDPTERAALDQAIADFVAEVGRTRAAREAGALAPADGRAALAAARNRVAEAVDQAVGAERAEALRARLGREITGGGW